MTIPAATDVPALRAQSIGEILDASFTLYRTHFGALATIVLACSVVPYALGVFLQSTGSGIWVLFPLILVYLVLWIVLGSVATGASVFVVSESHLGRDITAGEALRRAGEIFGRIFVCSFVLGLVIVMGLILFIVPGIVLACGLVLAVPVVVLEPGVRATEALSRSWALTKGNRWRLFGLLLTSFALMVVPMVAVLGLAAVFLPSGKEGEPHMVAEVASALVQLFLSPFIYCVLTTTYYDLRVRKEGFDLELLASSLRPA